MAKLSVMSSKFEHFIAAIDAVVDDGTLTSDFVKNHSIHEETQMYDRASLVFSNHSSLVNSTFRYYRGPSAPECSYCRKQVHTEPKCWTKYRHLKTRNKAIVAYSNNVYAGSDSVEYACLFSIFLFILNSSHPLPASTCGLPTPMPQRTWLSIAHYF